MKRAHVARRQTLPDVTIQCQSYQCPALCSVFACQQYHLNYSREHTLADALNHQAVWNGAMLQTRDIAASVRASMGKTVPKFDDI